MVTGESRPGSMLLMWRFIMSEIDLSFTGQTPKSKCPSCEHEMDQVTGPEQPKPGDVTICINCRHICIFDDEMKLRNPTDDEAKELAGNKEIITIMNALGKVSRDASD